MTAAGKCLQFCPNSELKLRHREKLIHKLERSEAGLEVVKEYSRPAAGQRGPNYHEVRSPETLLKCTR